jgi:hypothetical protein
MKIFLTILCLTLCAATANAAFIYDIDRTIGEGTALEGTVTGFIETDGTIGTLTEDNINYWEITLTSANLVGGSETFFGTDTGTGTGDILLRGNAVSADSTALWYDFDLAPSSRGNYFLLQSNSGTGNFWCLETNNCSGGDDMSEQIGVNISGGIAAWEARSGKIAFATVIPVPAAVWLFASGLLGLIGVSRLKR